MAIYRGSGGSTSTTDQATIDQVAEDAATATTKATEAANSASSAATSASSASTSATNAASSASSASSSASSASTSASNASTSASNASTSETNAATSETNASTSETNAAASAAAALSSKALALDAQTAAETAESNASDHADDAVKTAYGAEDVLQTLSDSSTLYSARHYAAKASADSATATTKASEASSSASAAASSASAAQAAEDAALAALDSFDDRYLGQKTSDPSTDNDGDALVAGALYYNTTDDIMKVYDGSVWVAAYASLSGTLVAANNLSDLTSVSAARTNLGLGTAATTASTDYATAAQGTLADSALQDITGESIEDLSDVATMTPTDGQLLTWDSTTSKWNAEDAPVSLPDQTGASGYYLTTNGTSASWDALATVANSGAYSDLSGTPTNVSTFTNDSGYLTSYTVTESDVTTHEAALSITESQITDLGSYLTTETDPVVGAVSGIVKANGAGTISAAVAGTDYLTPTGDGSSLTGISTDLVGDTTPQLGGDLDTNGNAIDFGASGWSIALSGTDLVFSYGGVAKIKFASDGEIVTVDDVTAFGTV